MRTVIIDDEPKARRTLQNFIAKYAPELQLVGQAENVEQGVELIDSVKPELVFLDVQMPDGTGFDLLGQVMFDDFKLIICTGHDHYAVKAFRFSAIDYLLKPIDPDIFIAAINKVKEESSRLLKPKLEVLNQNTDEFMRIALHSADGISLVNITEIVRLESNVNYTKFVLSDGTNILISKSLKEYDELLSEFDFIRIHKSHLINIKHVKQYIKGEGGWVILSDGTKVEVSRRKKDSLLAAIEKQVL